MTKREDELTWKDFNPGCIVTEAGNARAYKTGDWRSQKPTYDLTKCIKCGICFLYCPEGCIQPNKEGFFTADYYYCKGCGVCAKECPTKTITMVEEEE